MTETTQPESLYIALADPRRRQLLEWLAGREMSVSDLVSRSGWNQPLVSKQLAVLKAAGLVVDSRVGRHRIYRAQLAPLRPLVNWVQQLESRWQQQFDQLERYMAVQHGQESNDD